ncbi:MAG TPA: SRPBCC family protein [Candidatus Limnocylindria bacterium]|jgi:ribosome-associated toxin RatA of RatAB toxin-antitoxin module|nr:SRPBCC family protein [Candidatus Limnocylindria bacterium]
MSAPRYQFTTHWHLDAPARTVYDVLYRVEDYPKWWPSFVEVRSVGKDEHEMVLKSVLQYKISYVLENQIIDPRKQVLQGRVAGDIRGRISWDVDPVDAGHCVATFSEHVSVRQPILNTLSWLFRPVFRWNHGLAMKSGERGLRRYLASLPTAQPDPDPATPS